MKHSEIYDNDWNHQLVVLHNLSNFHVTEFIPKAQHNT